jgi:hypothetical protein
MVNEDLFTWLEFCDSRLCCPNKFASVCDCFHLKCHQRLYIYNYNSKLVGVTDQAAHHQFVNALWGKNKVNTLKKKKTTKCGQNLQFASRVYDQKYTYCNLCPHFVLFSWVVLPLFFVSTFYPSAVLFQRFVMVLLCLCAGSTGPERVCQCPDQLLPRTERTRPLCPGRRTWRGMHGQVLSTCINKNNY